MRKLDYLKRPVCAGCGHTEQLHDGAMCAAQLCYCRAFIAAGTPDAETSEAVSPHKEREQSVASR